MAEIRVTDLPVITLEDFTSNDRLIIVDDGATDNSGEICDNYALKDSRIIIFHKKNPPTL